MVQKSNHAPSLKQACYNPGKKKYTAVYIWYYVQNNEEHNLQPACLLLITNFYNVSKHKYHTKLSVFWEDALCSQ
jgi:hypothetical protein